MPLVRFSAAEQGGIVIPRPAMLSKAGSIILLFADAGIAPQQLPGGEFIDITPLSPQSAVHHLIQTAEEAPPERGMVHTVPRQPGNKVNILSPTGELAIAPFALKFATVRAKSPA